MTHAIMDPIPDTMTDIMTDTMTDDWPKWWCQGSFALLQCFSNFENNLVGEFHIAYMSQDPELDLVKGLLIILDEH